MGLWVRSAATGGEVRARRRPTVRPRFLVAAVLLLIVVNLLAVEAYANARFAPDQTGANGGPHGAVPAAVTSGGPLVGHRGTYGMPDRTVALTFDDGPDPTWTPRVLDVLAEHDVPATFFVLGSQVARNPGIARRMVAEGHRLGVHTFTHPDVTGLPGWRRRAEYTQTEMAITHATGQGTRLLRLPTDANSSDAAAETVSLHRVPDPAGISPTGSEAGLHRRFTTESSGTYTVKASAVPVTGEALDKLLYEVAPDQRDRITATADSTATLGTGLSARNLTDGDLTTAWIAGDRPTIHLSWDGRQPISEVVLAPAGGLSTRPTEVDITSPDGATVAGVDENGAVRFPPITTDRLDITITKTAPLTLHNPVADEDLQLPVGLTEAYLPALDQYRTPQPKATRKFSLPCGQGPVVAVDGKLYQTGVSGRIRDLTDRRELTVTLCQRGKAAAELTLPSGEHVVEAGDAGPLALTDLTLTRGTVAEPTTLNRELRIQDWLGDKREVTVGSGAASYLTTYENHNDGWTAGSRAGGSPRARAAR